MHKQLHAGWRTSKRANGHQLLRRPAATRPLLVPCAAPLVCLHRLTRCIVAVCLHSVRWELGRRLWKLGHPNRVPLLRTPHCHHSSWLCAHVVDALLAPESMCAWQAGHALVGALMPEYDPVTKISIIPRGNAGGLTFFAPSEERLESGLFSRGYLENQMSVAMGGRVAEELIFGPDNVTTGASGDFMQVLHPESCTLPVPIACIPSS